MFSNINVDMGAIPMKTLEAWANRDERIVKLRGDKEMLQKACAMWEEKCKAHSIHVRDIEFAKRILFEDSFKRNLIVNLARAMVEEYFKNGKTADELLSSTEWCQKLIGQTVDDQVSFMVDAAESMQRSPLVAIVVHKDASAGGQGQGTQS